MPTPYSHLWIAHRLLEDEALSQDAQEAIVADVPAYLLGSIVADARPFPGADREITHFYRYDKPLPDHPWQEMLRQNPALAQSQDASHRAFIAGYVAHLAADEYWTRHMVGPHFAKGDWGHDIRWRFYVLHLLLTAMDERDEARLPDAMSQQLRHAAPDQWLPFMDDKIIEDWRDYIADQLIGESETVAIFSGRIQIEPAEMRRILDDDQQMQTLLWQHITPDLLSEIEAAMYAFTFEQLTRYITDPAYQFNAR